MENKIPSDHVIVKTGTSLSSRAFHSKYAGIAKADHVLKEIGAVSTELRLSKGGKKLRYFNVQMDIPGRDRMWLLVKRYYQVIKSGEGVARAVADTRNLLPELVAADIEQSGGQRVMVALRPEPVVGSAMPAPATNGSAKKLDDLKRILSGLVEQPSVSENDVRRIVQEVLPEEASDLLAKVTLPEEKIEEVLKGKIEELRDISQPKVRVFKEGEKVKNLPGRKHYLLELITRCYAARTHDGYTIPSLLVGPPSSGKSSIIKDLAAVFESEWEAISVGKQTTKGDIFGFNNVDKFQETATYRRFVEGGIIGWDELDACNAQTATYLNMMLSNGWCGFPNGKKEKNKSFRFLGTGNTPGTGGTADFVARTVLDGATLDRLLVINFPIDEGFEASLIGVDRKSPDFDIEAGGVLTPEAWMNRVHEIRRAVASLPGVKHHVTMRATFYGTALFEQGIGADHVEQMVVWKGLDKATVNKIKSKI